MVYYGFLQDTNTSLLSRIPAVLWGHHYPKKWSKGDPVIKNSGEQIRETHFAWHTGTYALDNHLPPACGNCVMFCLTKIIAKQVKEVHLQLQQQFDTAFSPLLKINPHPAIFCQLVTALAPSDEYWCFFLLVPKLVLMPRPIHGTDKPTCQVGNT